MNTLKRTIALLVLAACLVTAGCGSDDEGAPIPANIADQLQARLDEVERRFEVGGGACADIENDSRPAMDQLVASVPNRVDEDVRQALGESVDRLFTLAAEQCQVPESDTDTEPAPAPEPEPLPTDTAPPETTETEPPPETTETTPPPAETETTPPPVEGEEGEGGEGGDGGGGGGEGGSGATGEGGSGGAVVPEDQG
jgi:hypothetical protein